MSSGSHVGRMLTRCRAGSAGRACPAWQSMVRGADRAAEEAGHNKYLRREGQGHLRLLAGV